MTIADPRKLEMQSSKRNGYIHCTSFEVILFRMNKLHILVQCKDLAYTFERKGSERQHLEDGATWFGNRCVVGTMKTKKERSKFKVQSSAD